MSVTDLLTASLADRYRIERELGEGGMATVYLGHDHKHDRKVAIKVLKPELAQVLGAERFLREIRTTANLRHPHILPLYDSGETAGFVYYVMPFVDGGTLRERLDRDKQLPIDEALTIAREVADALGYAHAQGVVHRDIKPENILLEGGHAVVADFGIARAMTTLGGERLTGTGMALGTPTYMSPEQASGERFIDGRSDLYSLGCVLYEMLGGRAPFVGPTIESVIRQHVMTDAPPITNLRPTVPAEVAGALARTLAKNPADRFNPAAQFVQALSPMSVSATAPVVVASVAAAPPRSARRSIIEWALLGVASAALVGWFVVREREVPTPATSPAKSIAVLPLVNVGGDSTQEYFADGMADELTNALGKLPGLKVAARTSSYAFKGRRDLDVKEVARKLGVDVVLQGSVRRAGDRIRVSVQLTDARQGVELWSNTYDRETKDAFAVQDSITQATVRQLALSLGASALAATRAGRTTSPEAHDLYLRAQTVAMQGTESALRRAIDLFRQAVAKDPEYAQAEAAIAFQYMSLADAFMPSNVAYDSSRTAARRALARDSLVGDARALVAFSNIALDWDFKGGELALREAALREPNSAPTQVLYAVYLCTIGRMAEGLAVAQAAMTLDPLNPLGSWTREECLYKGRRYDQLIAEHKQTVASWPDPRFFYWDSFLGAAYREKGQFAEALAEYERAQQAAGDVPLYGYAVTLARAGQTAKARAMLDRLLAYEKDHYLNPITLVAVYAAVGDRDQAFAWLDRTAADRTGWLWGIATWPEFDSLQQDPRLGQLIRRMGLPVEPRNPS